MAVRRAPTPRGSDLHAPVRASALRHSVVPDSPPPSTSPPPPAKPPTPRRVTKHGAILLPAAEPTLSCAFCGGDTLHNKILRPEDLVACYECGSAGHPTCLDWADPSVTYKRAKKYPWLCVDCKRCEVCDTKGADDDMLLCDSCDRGWHQHCLNPPMLKVPKTKWSCPTCASGTFFSGALSTTVLTKRPHLPVVGPFSLSLALPPNPAAAQTPRKRDKGKQKALDQSAPPTEITSVDAAGGLKLTLRLGAPSADPAPTTVDSLDGRTTAASALALTPAAEFKRRGRPPKHPRPPMTKDEHEENRRRIRERAEQRERDRALRDAQESDPDEDPDNDDEEQEEPYGGILDDKDRFVGDRAPGEQDRKRWERARDEADHKALLDYSIASVAPSTPAAAPATEDSPMDPASEAETSTSALDAHSLATALLAHRPAPQPTSLSAIPPGNVQAIRFGEYEIATWYQAPFPEEFSRVPEGRLWICEFCLKYMKGGFQAGRHRLKCKTRHPPGDEIYRDGKVSVFEVDGRKNKIYCQNLCLLAKMFLDHKTLYYDVEPFLFYVMTTADTTGAKFVGYFSKEKRSPTNNVSCIMTLPVRQRKGWGNLLIDFSYLLSKKEGRTGTPERPLSDLGLLSYRNYWTLIIFQYLNSLPSGASVTIEEISAQTALTPDDVFYILDNRSLITDLDAIPLTLAADPVPSPGTSTPSRGGGGNQWSSRKRTSKMATATLAGSSSSRPHQDDPHASPAPTIPQSYRIRWDPDVVRAHVEKYESKGYLQLRPERLQWSPFLVTRYGVDPPPPDPPSEPDYLGADANAKAGPSGEQSNGVHLPTPPPAPTLAATFDPSPHVNGTNGHSFEIEVEELESDDEGSVRVEEEYVDRSEESEYDEVDDDDELVDERLRKRRKFADADLDAPASRLRHSRRSVQVDRPLRSARREASAGSEPKRARRVTSEVVEMDEDAYGSGDEDAEGEDDDPDQSLGIVF